MIEHKLVNGVKVPLTEEELVEKANQDAEGLALLEKQKNEQYKLKRSHEYSPSGDQLDELLKFAESLQNGVEVNLTDDQGNVSTSTMQITLNSNLNAILAQHKAVKLTHKKPE